MDYFECLGLDFSRTVFEPETGFVSILNISIYILWCPYSHIQILGCVLFLPALFCEYICRRENSTKHKLYNTLNLLNMNWNCNAPAMAINLIQHWYKDSCTCEIISKAFILNETFYMHQIFVVKVVFPFDGLQQLQITKFGAPLYHILLHTWIFLDNWPSDE